VSGGAGGGAGNAEIEVLRSRLLLTEPGARRVAILDLVRREEPAALAALAEHLPRERDERGLLMMIERLRAARFAPAAVALRALYENAATAGAVAVMAARAADEIGAGSPE
jgi:hypothetical protein